MSTFLSDVERSTAAPSGEQPGPVPPPVPAANPDRPVTPPTGTGQRRDGGGTGQPAPHTPAVAHPSTQEQNA